VLRPSWSLSQAQVDNADQALQKAETQLTYPAPIGEDTDRARTNPKYLKQTQALLPARAMSWLHSPPIRSASAGFPETEEEYNQLIDSMRTCAASLRR